jgi:hypothetical protein
MRLHWQRGTGFGMPTNAQKQRRWRQRHLGVDGDMARLQVCLSLDARDRLDRLAIYYGYSITCLIEELAAAADRAVTAKLTGKALAAYRAGSYEDDPQVTA